MPKVVRLGQWLCIAAGADGTAPAGSVDFADDAPADPGTCLALSDHADELVAQNPAKAHVAACDLDIGVADAHQRRADQRLAGQQRGFGVIVRQPELTIEEECLHGCPTRLEALQQCAE